MRRGLVRTGAWAGATAAAVYVSWFGVHRALAPDSTSEPSALVVAVTVPTTAPPPPPPTSIHTPAETPSAAASPTPVAAASTPAAARTRALTDPPPPPSPTDKVTSYTRPGGLIVVAMGATSAHLITATPDPGWSVHTWTQPTWLRVDFEKPDGTDSVFYVTWNDHPPLVQT